MRAPPGNAVVVSVDEKSQVLGLRDRVQAVVVAYESGLVVTDDHIDRD